MTKGRREREMGEQGNNYLDKFAMCGGDGVQSYAKNSSIQRGVIDAAKPLIQNSIFEHLEPSHFPALKTLCIVDLGCSVGSNTLIAVNNIIQAVELKYQTTNQETLIPEFQVHFNDYSANDFNTLLNSLPTKRKYYASGVPGSFYARLFPRRSLHIVHSSNSLHWLSQVPKEIEDRKSGAWNKGRIFHVGGGEEVAEAYSRQHAADFSKFLEARAMELVPGGLVVLMLPVRPNGLHHTRLVSNIIFDILGDCFMELETKGVIDEEKVDAFNLPCYFPSLLELEKVIYQNGCFTIEKIEMLPLFDPLNLPSPQFVSLMIRAATEQLIKEHFGYQSLDQIFSLFSHKIENAMDTFVSSSSRSKARSLSVVLSEEHLS